MGRLALMQWVRDLAVLWMLLAGSAVFAAGQPAGSASIGGGESIAAGSFEEPLLPSRSPEATELRELKSFLGRYRKTSETGRIRELTAFLQRHPDSPWATALRVNLGLLHAHAGRITRAIGAWEMAWGDGRNHESSASKPLVDRALAELLTLHSRLGHVTRLEALLKESETWPVSAILTEPKTMAREALWQMQNSPETAFRCGPVALANLLSSRVRTDRTAVEHLMNTPAGAQGTTLRALGKLAKEAGLPSRLIHRTASSNLPYPSVAHLKQGHYVTLLERKGERYRVNDPVFGGDRWLEKAVLDEEASGYFLVPADVARSSARPISEIEAERIVGAGVPTASDPRATTPADSKDCDPCDPGSSRGMPTYSVHSMLVSLHLEDTPIGYTPPRGPAVPITFHYNQREAFQPAIYHYFNVGPKWTLNWLSYVQDSPGKPGANVSRAVAGGGWMDYGGYSGGFFAPEPRTDAVLERVLTTVTTTTYVKECDYNYGTVTPATTAITYSNSATDSVVLRYPACYDKPITTGSSYVSAYKRRLPDGTVEVYGNSDGSKKFPRKFFLTKIIDPAGNAVILTYDAKDRLKKITDDLGKITTFQYAHANPLLVTGITDPFNRTAAIEYDASGRLIALTDVAGMRSSFVYDTANSANPYFIKTMTTPYGSTKFAYGERTGPFQRWIEITAPLNNKERVEFINTGVAYSEPPALVPAASGLLTHNEYLSARNSFYWNKATMKAYPCNYASASPCNYTKARIKHFLHGASNTTSPILESIKYPLEARIWYNYPGQTDAAFENGATLFQPSIIARLLPDGTTQLTRYTYNSQGNVIKTTDPMGRETVYDYAPDGVDLVTVRQKNVTGGYDYLKQYTYNTQHLPLKYIDAAGKITKMTYNANGKLTSITNSNQEKTQYVYKNGYLSKVINANGATQALYDYDAYGRLAQITDSEGMARKFGYNNLDQLEYIEYQDGTRDRFVWSKLDLVRVIDRLGRETVYTYDAVRNLTSKKDPMSNITRYGYYENGLLKTLTDPNQNVTTWVRDIEGRVTAKVYDDGSRTSTTYDSVSRVDGVTDALSQTRRHRYWPDDLIKEVVYENALNPTAVVNFTYDPSYPRVTSMKDGTGTTSYSYYPVGQPGAGKLSSENGPRSYDTIYYGYDSLGRLASRRLDGDPSAESFGYDMNRPGFRGGWLV